MIKIGRFLFWAGIMGCFIGEALRVRVLDLFVVFPLRVIIVLAIPMILLIPIRIKKGIWGFAFFLLILMFIYGIASLSWSPDPSLGVRILNMLLTGLMIFLLVSRNAINLSVLRKMMVLWSVLIIGTNLLGIYEIKSGEYLFTHVTDFGATGLELKRIAEVGWLTPRVFLPNPNEFAFLNAISALMMIGWVFETRGVYRILALIAVILAVIMVMNSYSRAAIFGFLIGLLCFIFMFTTKIKLKYRIVTFLLIISFGILFLSRGEELLDNSSAASALVTKIKTYENPRNFYYTTATYQGTLGSYGFGRGLGASTEIIFGGSYHHYFLEILAELGFWFFLGYLFLIAKVCFQLWHAIQQHRNIFWSCGILASSIAFPICSAGPASLLYIYPYWLWLAFIVAFTEYDLIVMHSNQVTSCHYVKPNETAIQRLQTD